MIKNITKKNYNSKVKELIKHNKLYYDKSKPVISDREYDELKKEVKNLELKYNFLKNKNSIINKVGYKPSKSFEKFEHKTPMLSLSNAFNAADLPCNIEVASFAKIIFNSFTFLLLISSIFLKLISVNIF